jgi:hypothetical protein
MTRRTQLEVTAVVLFLGVLILTYQNATYLAYSHCNRNYYKFVEEIEEEQMISGLLQQADHQNLWKRIRLFSPCGYMYSGYNHLLPYAGIGWGFIVVGILLGLDTLRIKNRPCKP